MDLAIVLIAHDIEPFPLTAIQHEMIVSETRTLDLFGRSGFKVHSDPSLRKAFGHRSDVDMCKVNTPMAVHLDRELL